MRSVIWIFALVLVAIRPAFAEAPRVLTDIAPVHSLVSMVMEGVAEPELLIRGSASPHDYALRPSDARKIEKAQVIFWIGEPMTPWLAPVLSTLAPSARSVELLEAPNAIRLSFREGALFGAHDHGPGRNGHGDEHHGNEHGDAHTQHHEQGHGDKHGHDHAGKHDDDHHQEHAGHDDHAEHAGHDHHAHGAGDTDPHAWLDPRNAQSWLDLIATTLGAADPKHAEAYRANARAARAQLQALETELHHTLAPVQGQRFLVFHDAFHYFEARFGVEAAGAVATGDAVAPGAARLSKLQDGLEAGDIRCIFSEPQLDDRLAQRLAAGSKIELAILDPIGADLPPGAALYPELLRAMAKGFAGCLSNP